MEIDYSTYNNKKNVFYITEKIIDSNNLYLKARKNEGRILTDKEVGILPNLNRFEWPFRIQSTQRIIDYISRKKRALAVLDIGCGNGWFSNKIAKIPNVNNVVGLDINKEELEQAASVFKSKYLKFVYADVFKTSSVFEAQFDIITLNGVVQYFENFSELITLLHSFLKPNGEIHIIDSPFYKTSEIKNAKESTKKYYTNLGVPEMAKHYHAHDKNLVANFDTLYTYKRNILHKMLGKKESPFSWYRFIKK
ncbi:class I SAM-dependent methyltransferase [Lacinutrix jangbogonensis]|uniref:class I SAM-dependent methyltransferase n=1 Tax=Lacinutrix jangbogonensis TaxID=1469557 RepID=UPI00053DCB92|nr:class I SAM-dependent methyltransferase [Lacinutrix jangbogonensis]